MKHAVTPMGALTAITTAAALQTLVHSGVLDVLESAGPLTTEDLAARAHVRTESLGLMLAPLAESGVVERDESGRWSPVGTAAAWRLLLPSGDSPFSHFLEGAITGGDDIGWSAPLERGYAEIAEVIGRISGSAAAQASAEYATAGGRLLELGAGDAPWARIMLTMEPTMTAVAVDQPAVAARLRERTEVLAVGNRIEVIAADVLAVELDGPFDVIVVSSLCRLLDAEQNARLFRRLARWATASTRILIFDAVRDGIERAGLAAYELSLARRTRRGRIYDLGDFERWATDAHLGRPSVRPIAIGCHVLIEVDRTTPIDKT